PRVGRRLRLAAAHDDVGEARGEHAHDREQTDRQDRDRDQHLGQGHAPVAGHDPFPHCWYQRPLLMMTPWGVPGGGVALKLVSYATREPSVELELAALVSLQPLDKTVTASPRIAAGTLVVARPATLPTPVL